MRERLLFTSCRMLDNLRFRSATCSALKVIGLLGRPIPDDGPKHSGKQAGDSPQGMDLTARTQRAQRPLRRSADLQIGAMTSSRRADPEIGAPFLCVLCG